MKLYTIDNILAMKPCQPEYNRKNLERLFAGKTSLDSQEILRKRIPLEDKLWIGSEMLTGKQQRELACWCALQVIHLWEVPKIVLQYLKTQDESIRAAAWAASKDAAMDAAKDAARDAAWAAAWAAARDVAWASARDAAWDAAMNAAWASARDAAWDAAWDAAMNAAWAAAGAAARAAVRAAIIKKQINKIRRILKEEP